MAEYGHMSEVIGRAQAERLYELAEQELSARSEQLRTLVDGGSSTYRRQRAAMRKFARHVGETYARIRPVAVEHWEFDDRAQAFRDDVAATLAGLAQLRMASQTTRVGSRKERARAERAARSARIIESLSAEERRAGPAPSPPTVDPLGATLSRTDDRYSPGGIMTTRYRQVPRRIAGQLPDSD